MFLNKKLIFSILFLLLARSRGGVSGIIKNQYGLRIPNANLHFVARENITDFQTTTDTNGVFQIDIPTTISTKGKNRLLSPYPNPNRGAVYIPFYQYK